MNKKEGKENNPLFFKADQLAKEVYLVTKNFPQNEMYGIISQLRRAALSVILNIIEGFARQGEKEFRRFLLIAYGSLKETKYLLYFSKEQEYVVLDQYQKLLSLAEEESRLLWSVLHPKINEQVTKNN